MTTLFVNAWEFVAAFALVAALACTFARANAVCFAAVVALVVLHSEAAATFLRSWGASWVPAANVLQAESLETLVLVAVVAANLLLTHRARTHTLSHATRN